MREEKGVTGEPPRGGGVKEGGGRSGRKKERRGKAEKEERRREGRDGVVGSGKVFEIFKNTSLKF